MPWRLCRGNYHEMSVQNVAENCEKKIMFLQSASYRTFTLEGEVIPATNCCNLSRNNVSLQIENNVARYCFFYQSSQAFSRTILVYKLCHFWCFWNSLAFKSERAVLHGVPFFGFFASLHVCVGRAFPWMGWLVFYKTSLCCPVYPFVVLFSLISHSVFCFHFLKCLCVVNFRKHTSVKNILFSQFSGTLCSDISW